MSDLNPVISDFDVSCCYFETMDDNSVELETYIREVVVVGILFLIFNLRVFSTMIVCVARCIQPIYSM